jgi:hypothetical protein
VTESALKRNRLLAPVKRWTTAKKFYLIHGVELKIVSKDDVLSAHGITIDEWNDWVRRYDGGGVGNLKVTRRPKP